MRRKLSRSGWVSPARRRLGPVAVLLAVLGLVGPAGAQVEMRSFYQGYSPTVDRDDVEAMTVALDLDDTQEQLVAALYEGYRNSYNPASDAARDSLRHVRDSMQNVETQGVRENLYSQYNRLLEEWGRQSMQLEVNFFADVKNLLSDEQAARWPRYERDRLRRVGLLLAAALMPERVDLVALLDSLELDEAVRAACEPLVERYTVEFDEPLRERIRVSDRMEAASYAADAKGGDAQIQSLQQRLVRLHVRIRDINLEYLGAIAAQLPPEDGERLRDAFRRRVWPRLFAFDEVEADVRRVRALAALSQPQSEAVAALVGAYHTRVEPIHRELVQLEMTRELQRISPPQAQGTQPIKLDGAESPGEIEDRTRELLQSRQTLIQSTLSDIRSMLTPDQLRALTQGTAIGEPGTEESTRQ